MTTQIFTEENISLNIRLPNEYLTVHLFARPLICTHIQWNLSIKDTPNEGHLSTEETVCRPNHIEVCTNLPLN